MKKNPILLAFCISLFLHFNATANNTWTQKASSPSVASYYPAFFTIGHNAFVGCGYDGSYLKTFYRWNQPTNTWSSIASYPGNGSLGCLNFSIEGKGYVGMGGSSSSRSTDLWRYDSVSNSWTQMASLPGTARYDQTCFVLGHKAYMICGSSGGPPYMKEVWVYDAHANSWTQLSNFPGGQLEGVITFAIGNRGYAGGGWDGSSYHNTFWQYDTTNDSWTSIASIPVASGVSDGPAAFVIGTKAYVCVGGNTHTLSSGYAYDTATKAWSTFTNMGANGIERGWAAAFTINNYGYICMGQDSNSNYLNSLWQYSPDSTIVEPSCDVWAQKASSPAIASYYPAFFTIGHNAFVGCGYNGSYFKTFYRWNQPTNTWSSIASYPGNGSLGCLNFSIEGKGYVGMGGSSSSRSTDLWRYDSVSNTWTQMTSLPSTARYDQTCFVLGHKAYMICGSAGGPPYMNDVWVYDAHANTWSQLSNFPGGQREGVITFAIGNRGYAGGGWNGSSYTSTFWQYDTTNDSWTSIASIPVASGVSDGPAAFVIGSKAYVCVGGNTHALSSGYAYDTTTKAWTTFTNMGANGIERGWAAAFTINNCGYICMGQDSSSNYLNSLWQYYPCSDTILNLDSIQVVSSPKCNGDATGSASVSVTGGFTPYTYSWNSFPVQTNAIATSLSGGTYTVTVTDSHTNTLTASVIITQPSQLRDSIVSSTNNSATIGVQGGTGSYTYLWAPGGQTTVAAIGLSAGTYTISTKDANGCSIIDSVTINIVSAIDQIQTSDKQYNLYPNPSDGRYNFSYFSSSSQNSELRISNVLGKLINAYPLKGEEGIIVVDESSLCNGIYFYQVANKGEVIYNGKFIIAK